MKIPGLLVQLHGLEVLRTGWAVSATNSTGTAPVCLPSPGPAASRPGAWPHADLRRA